MRMLWLQTLRNLKIFVKDKANIFFALLAPLIVLGLYVLFLGKTQTDTLLDVLKGMGVTGADDDIRSFADCWILSGVMASAGITVPLCACGVMVQDETRGIRNDLLSAPIPRWMPSAAYFLAVVLSGFLIGFVVLALCLGWLALSGGWFLSALEVLGLVGLLLLSVLSSSTLLVFVVGFLRTEGAFTGLNVILGTVIGFLIGAYMPLSMFPKGVQYVTLFVPGSYSAALFRNLFLNGALENISQNVSAAYADSLAEKYTIQLAAFGTSLSVTAMALILAGTVLLFAAANLVKAFVKKNTR